MPYDREILFNPSDKFKNTWSMAPQNLAIEYSDDIKTNSMFADLSAAIPIFYLLTFLAISFDVYLGFAVLKSAGVNLTYVVISIILDIFLAIVVYLIALKYKNFNDNYLKNKLFKLKLELISRLNDESIDDFSRRQKKVESDIKSTKRQLNIIKSLKWIFSLIILVIAIWKISFYMHTLPPNMNILNVTKGKIVIILALLTAVFHILATEKTAASLWFNHIKNKEIKNYMSKMSKSEIEKATKEKKYQPINYIGNYTETKINNTSLKIDEKTGEVKVEYIHVIWDDEIKYLMDVQSDDDAKKGVLIACKQTQLF